MQRSYIGMCFMNGDLFPCWLILLSLINRYFQVYLDQVVVPMQEYLKSLEGRPAAKACNEPGDLGKNRSKLQRFLKESKHYTPQRMISRFFDIDGLYEERAMLLGRIGRHDQALNIYAHKLSDPAKAEEYCKSVYDPEDKDTREVFISLLQIYLKPPEGVRVNLNVALGILKRHYDKLDTAKALDLLPGNTKVSDIHAFLTAVMRKRFAARKQGQVLMNLLKAKRLQVHQELLRYHAKRITSTTSDCASYAGSLSETAPFTAIQTGLLRTCTAPTAGRLFQVHAISRKIAAIWTTDGSSHSPPLTRTHTHTHVHMYTASHTAKPTNATATGCLLP